MDAETRKRILDIIDGMSCPKDFACAESGFEVLCRAMTSGMDSFLECLDEKPRECRFSFSFGNSCFCSCPLRIYLARHLDD